MEPGAKRGGKDKNSSASVAGAKNCRGKMGVDVRWGGRGWGPKSKHWKKAAGSCANEEGRCREEGEKQQLELCAD